MESLRDALQSHVLIGTPGRIFDLIERDQYKKSRTKLMDKLKILILDEADILLAGNFVEKIKNIIKSVPQSTQICLFSATYPPQVLELVDDIVNNPVKILVENEKISVASIKNYYVQAQYERFKYEILIDFYKNISICQAVIFVNSVKRAMDVGDMMSRDGHSVGIIHSDLSDLERAKILKDFRTGQTRILVATDIISRGIDVQQVGLIINYDVPQNPEQYIHRVGRSGRYGKTGVAITLVTCSRYDEEHMINIENTYKIKFAELPELDDVNKYLTGSHIAKS
jgi:translation initiation factor 4A